MKIPKKYIPPNLSKKNKKILYNEIMKSRDEYKKNRYYTRKKINGFKHKKSKWENKVRDIYKINKNKNITLTLLSNKSKCNKKSLKKIINKGMGAYYSSGSRPNQNAFSWGKARLYSALSGGPSSRIDSHILLSGCKPSSKSIKLLNKTQKGGNVVMKEKIIRFEKSNIKNKKYRAYIKNLQTNKIRHIDFGDNRYQQYKDRTGLNCYTHKNHNDIKRMRRYFSRHSGTSKRLEGIKNEKIKSGGIYNAKILSHIYLW